MKKILLSLGLLLAAATPVYAAPDANIRLTDISLMHESRATPNPSDGWVESERAISFQWPMPAWARGKGAPLDGMEHTVKKVDKSKLKYRLRYSTDKSFPAGKTVTVDRIWPFYNPEKPLAAGQWFWQHALVNEGGTEEWSPVYSFTVVDNPKMFAPPSYKEFINKLPKSHPRILIDAANWDEFRAEAKEKPEYKWYLEEPTKPS